MIDDRKRISRRTQLGLGAALAVALGAAGGAGAVSLTRPTIEMAPTVPTAIAKLPASSGVVTVKGRVAEVYGNKFVVQDATGRTMVDAGRDRTMTAGTPVMVQGRFDDGQLHASYLVDPNGRVEAVGPMGPRGARGPEGRGPDGRGPGRDGPPPPPPPGGPDRGPGVAGADAPPPPPGCGPVGAVGAVLPAPMNGMVPPPVAKGALPVAPAPTPTATPAT